MKYTIKTVDGVVVRATATRPYVAAWIGRTNGTPIHGGHSEFTTKPKLPFGTTEQKVCYVYGVRSLVTRTYERVVATVK